MTLDEFKQRTGLYLSIERVGEQLGRQMPLSQDWTHFLMLVGCYGKEIMVPGDHQFSVPAEFVFERFITMIRYFERCDYAGFRVEYSEVDEVECGKLFQRIGEHAASLRKMLGEDYLTLIDEVVL